MRHPAIRFVGGTAAMLLLGGAERPAALPDLAPGPEIVVTAVRPPAEEVVVTAPPHCRRRPGDPADLVPVSKGITNQRVIAPGANGALEWRRDDEPLLGPAVWQRAGNAIGDYRYRTPGDGTPLCIGALLDHPNGWGQLRQIVAAEAMRGKYLHFSALVATRQADEVRFWLAAGDAKNQRGIGGDTHTQPIFGTHGWRQVDLVIGPVPKFANHVSYGFLLYGGGDVWLNAPRLEVLDYDAAQHVAAEPVSSKWEPRKRSETRADQ
jgi:hypothetical protein